MVKLVVVVIEGVLVAVGVVGEVKAGEVDGRGGIGFEEGDGKGRLLGEDGGKVLRGGV